MINYKVLERYGTTNAKLKELFNSRAMSKEEEASVPPEKLDQCRSMRSDLIKARERFEDRFRNKISEHIEHSLRNSMLWAAVDLAWDSTPINKATIPLMMYAQGKLTAPECQRMFTSAINEYVRKDGKDQVVAIDVPKFVDININLIRSVITRRLAAQSNRYSNLWPFYRYESRSTQMKAKLMADVFSQIMDIQTDWWDHRSHDVQVMRDTLLYARSVDFVASSWITEHQIDMKTGGEDVGGVEELVDVVVREGVQFFNPHPSRVFWDNNYPLSSINSDSGVGYIGYWDVMRYQDIAKNSSFFGDKENITFTTGIASLFSTYQSYFSQYYTSIKPPTASPDALASDNDRKNWVGRYAAEDDDSAVIVTTIFEKLIPKDYGIGDYPHPVWFRFVCAGDSKVVFAEIMPTTPAAYCGYNEHDGRAVNISVAHELMSIQDQLTNLTNFLINTLKSDNNKILLIDIDALEEPQRKVLRSQAEGRSIQNNTMVLEVSRTKMAELGIDVAKVIQLVETQPRQAIDIIFRAIQQLIQMAERLMALSPQEQGQPAPREISATETNLIAGTTESVYGFISDSVDAFRAAKKRILYESWMACAKKRDIEVPIALRYADSTIREAGFEVTGNESNGESVTVSGEIKYGRHDIVFTTRDGAERASNTQAANVLNQLLMSVLANPVTAEALGRQKVYDLMNEVFRLSGAGVDLKLVPNEGDNPSMASPTGEQNIQQVLQQLIQQVEENTKNIDAISQSSVNPQPQPVQ